MKRFISTVALCIATAAGIALLAAIPTTPVRPSQSALPWVIEATDYTCMQRCLAQGFLYAYCQRVCGY